jgi:hypothetical protein
MVNMDLNFPKHLLMTAISTCYCHFQGLELRVLKIQFRVVCVILSEFKRVYVYHECYLQSYFLK